MNLWFRFFRVLFISWFQPKMTWDEQLRMDFRIWPSDLDFNLHMTNSRYMALMDLGRLNLIVRSGMGRLIRRDGLAPVIANAMIRFRRPVQVFERVTVITQVIGWDAKWQFIEHRMERGGELVSQAFMKVAFLGKNGTIPPQQLAETMGFTGAPPALPDWIADWQRVELAAGGKGKSGMLRS